jgi:hypothetical protein
VQHVRIDRERRFTLLVLRDRNLMLLGKIDQVGARLERPVPPRRDDLDVRVQRISRQFEPHLVVALAGGTMGHCIRPRLGSNLDQPLGNKRTGNRRAQKVDPFIKCIGPEHREHEIGDELLAQVLDIDFLDAQHLGLAPRRLQLITLAQVSSKGDHFRTKLGLQPLQDDRRIKPTRIGQHDLLDRTCCSHLTKLLSSLKKGHERGPRNARTFKPRGRRPQATDDRTIRSR